MGCNALLHFFGPKKVCKSFFLLILLRYDITVVSPRNYFTFTPLLPSVCAGTLSIFSCMEPVRNFTRNGNKKVADFYEAAAIDVDFNNKKIKCKHTDAYRGQKHDTGLVSEFELNYDKLVVAVGAESNTFNISGVLEHAYFLKEVEHARDIRKEVMNRFEKAALPETSSVERDRLLHFIVVGGGPTGVETAAEFGDFVRDDLAKYFPELVPHVKISLIERGDKLLPMFSPTVSEKTLQTFHKSKINTFMQHAVVGVTDNDVQVLDCTKKESKPFNIPYGLVIWCSGLGQVPIAKHLMSKIESQKTKRVLTVDPHLQVQGVTDVFAIGDCAFIEPKKSADHVDEIFQAYLTYNASRKTSLTQFLNKKREITAEYPQLMDVDFNDLTSETKEELHKFLTAKDKAYRSPAPTAQNARQEGWYLSEVFNAAADGRTLHSVFNPVWRGSLAYVGHHTAAMDLPGNFAMVGGPHTLLAWKAIYLTMHLSWRNRVICCFDWLKQALAGRDLGRDHLKQSKLKTPWGDQ